MFYIEKTFEISASHHLILDYESKCTEPHGHNWLITIYCKSDKLNHNGMVVDFSEIKHNIKDKLDHKDLNKVLPVNTTAENIAQWICQQITNCYKVKVQESQGNVAIYEV
ncbi:MAG: 6-carboxytetrahydropterin synthase QueD [Bacteroidetes bacterium]|jgi:6-pyruvoyltetrahydropterin/6-carboxytetrahydropterin synthase|nr:6-carboxytetrahydropterin synthase QueD [Bacteroidota bacterium]